MTSIEGVDRNGQIELAETPTNVPPDTRVIVTFIESKEVDLNAHGIDQAQALALRSRLATFAEDWNSPEMSIYDNYDAAKSNR